MDDQEFISIVENTLEHKPEEALTVYHQPSFSDIIENSSWKLVPVICTKITEKNCAENPSLYNNCVGLLMEIAKMANPEDILFELMAQIEEPNGNVCCFVSALRALQLILIRMPQRRGLSMGWCCNAIVRYITEIPIPEAADLEGNEQILLESKQPYGKIEETYLEIIEFYLPFIKEVEKCELSIPAKHFDAYKYSLLKGLLKLLGHPLMFTNLEHHQNKTTFRCIAERILHYIDCFNIDLFSFLEAVLPPNKDLNSPVDSEFTNTSLAVFYYLVLVEGIYIEKIPCVYSNFFIWGKLMYLSVCLMSSDEANAQWKGLSLMEPALSRIHDGEISFETVDRLICKQFVQVCAKLMIYSEQRRNREKAVLTFGKFLQKFDSRARYYMLISTQDEIKEPGLIGYLATKTKDFISEALSSKTSEKMKYFCGKCLCDLIKRFCCLDKDLETDLTRYGEQIIPTLNLLRYLVIRDGDNVTGFFALVPTLESCYFSPLRKAIEISRAHYNLQKKQLDDPLKSSGNQILTGSVTVEGSEIPDLTCEQRLQIVNGALNLFDLIESLLTRVTECIHDRSSREI